MFCEKCGKQINDEAAFCPYCGHTMTPVINSVINEDGHKRINFFSLTTVILFVVQVVFFLCQIIFSKISIDESVMGDMIASNPEISGLLNKMPQVVPMLFFYFCGGILLVTSVVFVFAILIKSQKLLIIGSITGFVVSFGAGFGFILFAPYFLLLYFKVNKIRIPTALLIVLEVLGGIILLLTSGGFSPRILYCIGLIAGIVAYALLSVVVDKMEQFNIKNKILYNK